MSEIDFETVAIEWRDPPPDDIRENVEAAVRADMRRALDSLEIPSDLLFHNVFLGDNTDGPSVYIHSSGNGFMAFYSEKTEWMSLQELDGEA